MTDNETSIDGNVTGPVVSGTFNGPTQTVTVQLPPQTEHPKDLGQYMEALWKLVIVDQAERYVRQHEVDEFRKFVTDRLDSIDDKIATIGYRTILSLVVSGIITLVVIGVLMYVTHTYW